jgi:hypothetical protein
MTATTSSPSAVIAVAEPVFTSAEQLALAGFLAGYAGLTREACGHRQSRRARAAVMHAGSDRQAGR